MPPENKDRCLLLERLMNPDRFLNGLVEFPFSMTNNDVAALLCCRTGKSATLKDLALPHFPSFCCGVVQNVPCFTVELMAMKRQS